MTFHSLNPIPLTALMAARATVDRPAQVTLYSTDGTVISGPVDQVMAAAKKLSQNKDQHRRRRLALACLS